MKYKIVTYGTMIGANPSVEKEVITKGGYNDFELVHISGNNDKAFFKAAEDADAVCAWVYLDTEEKMKRFKKCQIIVAPAIGVDRFNLDVATELGICIANVPDYCIEEVAFHTIAMVFDCCRKITFLDRKINEGWWSSKSPYMMYRMKGRTYGLMSFGNIPQRIAQMLKPFGLNIIAYDPFVKNEVFETAGVERVATIDELFSRSNYVSVHTPHLPETHHIISENQLNIMPEGAIIVVTGRGGVVDENALKDALESGKLSCAGVEVIEDETENKSVLMGVEHVVMTSHVAYSSEDANTDLKRKAFEQIVDVVRYRKAPHNLVNKSVLGKARFENRKEAVHEL